MRRNRTGRLLAVATLFAVMVVAAPAGAMRGVDRSTSDVMWFGDPTTAVGTSQLIRTEHAVVGSFRTSGLMPREALTLWWVVFNDPAGCSAPCGEDDIFIGGDPTQGLNHVGITAADIVVGYAAGTVANRHGQAVMVGSLREHGRVGEVLFGDVPVLEDAAVAEIHLVARSHGPAVAGLIADQIGSYAGGCLVNLHPPAIPTQVGECGDIQFAVHLP